MILIPVWLVACVWPALPVASAPIAEAVECEIESGTLRFDPPDDPDALRGVCRTGSGLQPGMHRAAAVGTSDMSSRAAGPLATSRAPPALR